jgi:uncharacterized protein (DUF305 family)
MNTRDVTYTVSGLPDLAQHFAGMIPHIERALSMATTKNEKAKLQREIATLRMVVYTIEHTIIRPTTIFRKGD